MIRTSYQLTALFATPAALGVAVYARPILKLLFSGEAAAVSVAAPLLSLLGVSIFLSCMITATNSVLHAYQQVNRPILAMLIGAVVKIAAAYILIGNPNVALLGAPISTFLCNTAVVLFNFYFACSLCKVSGLPQVFRGPLTASVLAVGMSYGVYWILASHLGERGSLTLVAIFCAIVLYLIFSCLFGVLHEEDLLALPMGERICKVFKKLRLLETERREGDVEEDVV